MCAIPTTRTTGKRTGSAGKTSDRRKNEEVYSEENLNDVLSTTNPKLPALAKKKTGFVVVGIL